MLIPARANEGWRRGRAEVQQEGDQLGAHLALHRAVDVLLGLLARQEVVNDMSYASCKPSVLTTAGQRAHRSLSGMQRQVLLACGGYMPTKRR